MIFIEADLDGRLLGVAQVKCDNHGIDIGMSSSEDRIAQKFTEEEFAQISNVPLEIFLNNTRDYVFIHNKILVRPMIKISCSSTDISDDGVYFVPINSDVELTVEYYDPDAVGYSNGSINVYVKDDSDFLNIDAQYQNFELIDKKVIVVRSAFPGISRLKAKDIDKRCNYNKLLLRFKQ